MYKTGGLTCGRSHMHLTFHFCANKTWVLVDFTFDYRSFWKYPSSQLLKINLLMKILVKFPGLWLQDSSGAVKINYDDIVYCEHASGVTKIVYICGKFKRVQVPLKRIEEKLCKQKFYRCHRNYLVNLDKVGNYDEKDEFLIMKCRINVPVSRRRRNNLKIRLGLSSPEQNISA